MLAHCPRCFYLFQSNAFDFQDVTVTLEENNVQCPNCGALANLPEGKFHFDKDGIARVLSVPDVSADDLVRLLQLTKTATQEKYTPDLFLSEAEKINPALSGLGVFAPKSFSDLMLFFGILVTLILGLLNEFRGKDPTVENHYHYYSSPEQEQVEEDIEEPEASPTVEGEEDKTEPDKPKRKRKKKKKD